MALVAAIIGHYLRGVSRTEHGRQIVHNPLDIAVNIISGNRLKDLPKERIGFRNKIRRFLSGEILRRGIIQPGCEHAIHNGLSIDVRELFGLQVMDEHIAERPKLRGHLTVALLAVQGDGLRDGFREEVCLSGHLPGEGCGEGDALAAPRHSARYERFELVAVLRDGGDMVPPGLGYSDGVYVLPAYVQVEVQVVREDDAVDGRPVTGELLFVSFPSVEVAVVDVLGLKERHGDAALGDDVVRRTALLAARLVCDDVSREERAEV